MDLDTTIVALSSPVGRSPHALVRASGDRAFSGARTLGLSPEPRRLHRDRLRLEKYSLPVLLASFPASSSFTGQDTIEIQLPGNPFLVQRVVEDLIASTDGRHAEAGEFTARAFFSGRISLSQAEGVCATISASNNAELLGASLLREGVLASIVQPMSDSLLRTLSRIEAEIDFSQEEDVVIIGMDEREQSIRRYIETIETTLDGCIPMATLQRLPHVVLAGTPNAGKSTLFNVLLGERRVVVSDKAGTTRDAISEPVMFCDREAILVDIAGVEKADDKLSTAMQRSAENAIALADLVLWCIEPNKQYQPPPPNTVHMIVHMKGDVPGAHPDAICALTGRGIESLRLRIAHKLNALPTPREDAMALLPRHEAALSDALSHLRDAINHIDTPELTAASLRMALDAIGAITGHITPDEVLGEVFSTFCIGK